MLSDNASNSSPGSNSSPTVLLFPQCLQHPYSQKVSMGRKGSSQISSPGLFVHSIVNEVSWTVLESGPVCLWPSTAVSMSMHVSKSPSNFGKITWAYNSAFSPSPVPSPSICHLSTINPLFARGKRFERCSSICASFELRLFSPFIPLLYIYICFPEISEHPLELGLSYPQTRLGSATSASGSTILVPIDPGYRPVSWRQRNNLHSNPSINNSAGLHGKSKIRMMQPIFSLIVRQCACRRRTFS